MLWQYFQLVHTFWCLDLIWSLLYSWEADSSLYKLRPADAKGLPKAEIIPSIWSLSLVSFQEKAHCDTHGDSHFPIFVLTSSQAGHTGSANPTAVRETSECVPNFCSSQNSLGEIMANVIAAAMIIVSLSTPVESYLFCIIWSWHTKCSFASLCWGHFPCLWHHCLGGWIFFRKVFVFPKIHCWTSEWPENANVGNKGRMCDLRFLACLVSNKNKSSPLIFIVILRSW